MTWTVPCLQFHTHRPFQHSKASRYFETAAKMGLSVRRIFVVVVCFVVVVVDWIKTNPQHNLQSSIGYL